MKNKNPNYYNQLGKYLDIQFYFLASFTQSQGRVGRRVRAKWLSSASSVKTALNMLTRSSSGT